LIPALKPLAAALLLCLPLLVQGQKAEDAKRWGNEGISLLDKGEYKDAIKLLTKAWNAQPAEFDYPFELGRAYVLSGKAAKAEKVLHPLQYHKEAGPELYLLLALAYDSLGRSKPKEETYRYGIQRFPDAGVLYNRLAAHYVNRDSVASALAVCEAGMAKSPAFADNYFLAARIMDAKGDALWAWWYGEVFLNLSDDAANKRDMSRSVSTNATRVVNSKWKPGPVAVEMAVKAATAHCADVDVTNAIAAQAALRECFITHYPGKDAYSELLRKMKQQGVMQLYAAHLFGELDKEAFLQWLSVNAVEFERFRQWFYWNGLRLDAPFTRHTIIAP
jgi:tetratricopeptide (TPR) repeat protein